MPRVILGTLVVSAFLGAAICRQAEAAIWGTVVDAAGQPVHGARVALVPMGFFDPSGALIVHVESGIDGSFRLADAGAAHYGVTATAPGSTAAFVSRIEDGRAGLRLQLGSAGRHLFGRVTDRNGRPVAGAEVRLAPRFSAQGDIFLVESAADGRWSADVPEGEYYANAVSPGYYAAQRALPRGGDSVDLVLDPVWPEGQPPPDVVDWLRAHELPLVTAEVGHGFADLAPLRTLVGDARVVGLGEVTHGTHEIFQIKRRVLEFLVSEMGFSVFAIETSLPESFAIDDYVLGGPGDPELLLAGQFVAVWQTEELRDLIRWMREWNRTHARKVRFHGLDMRKGVRAAKETLAYLERVDPAAASSEVARALAPMADPFESMQVVLRPGLELKALARQARELVERFDSQRAGYVARSSAESWWRSAMQARVLAQLLEWRTSEGSSVRERAMADNAVRAIEHYGPDAKAVVWAHNAHIAANSEVDPRMMGSYLRAHFDAAYRPLGSSLDRGSYQAIDPSSGLLRDFEVTPAAPGSIEDALASAGRAVAVLNLRTVPGTGVAAEWLRSYQAMRQFDGLYDDDRPRGWASPLVIVSSDYDALLFVAAGTVARQLPFAREVFVDRPPPPARELANLDFEDAEGTRPRAWLWSQARERVCGYALTLDPRRPFSGRASARITRTREPRYGECAGQLRQLIDASSYGGKRIRMSAAIRVERGDEHAHLYIESGVGRASERASGSGWRTYDVTLDVPRDARTLDLGLAFDGEGRAWFDAVSLTALP